MSVLFNTVSRYHSFSSKEQASFNSWLQSTSTVILEPTKIKSVIVSIPSPPHLFAIKWWDWMPCSLFLLVLSFKPVFHIPLSPSSTGSLFSSSLLSAVRVVLLHIWGYWYAMLPAMLIPTCASSSLAFHMMYSAYKLNKQGDSMQPWRTPFSILN